MDPTTIAPRFPVPTHEEALSSAADDLEAAQIRLASATERLRRIRRRGRDPKAALLYWNLARNEVEHRTQQVAWWRRQLADHPDLAHEPILDRSRRQGGAAHPLAVSAKPAGDCSRDERSTDRDTEVSVLPVRIAGS